MKPLGLRFARGSDGGAYVKRSDPNLGSTDSNIQVNKCMYLLCSLISLQLGVFLVALCLVPSLGMQSDWWKEPTKLLSASVLHALPFRHIDIRICCTVSSDQICSEPQGSTC